LQYHRARYYNAGLGTWASLDPFEGIHDRPMSLNGYAWVEGNVSNAIDPSGRISSVSFANLINGSMCDQNNSCSFIQILLGQCLTPTPNPTIETPISSVTLTPSLTELNEKWSQETVAKVRQESERACLSAVVDREVGWDLTGSGDFAQAVAITWVVLNNLALTKNLDAGLRHGNNLSVVYCNVSSISPCNRGAGFRSPNLEIESGIESALNAFQYKSPSDPTQGSLQWRHIPNDGWVEFNIDQVERKTDLSGSPLENAGVFYERHITAATRFLSQNPGRISFPPKVTSIEEALQFNDQLFKLGTLAVFSKTALIDGSNLQHVLDRNVAGLLQTRNSCGT
jgi:hypothetical protein